ncbi:MULTISPECIES: lysis protein [Pseudomonas]|uniref:lysis protein n=1 Tax=Pseudomonas TaxID=286 RepID=UPI00069333FD|nr:MULTISPECIES: lysis protein [Pseudomonas]AZD95325.1 hypothetical protein C4K13_5953 [Pseudomonas chlororaphis subsp. aureofaciens]KAB0523070.1 lysis protein [Pseudomonas chlororaphis subsp. aureofaciens]TSD29373.1 lysis protein [Pseudomonas sp. ATCC 13985]WDG47835.1 lysis protein [Pseudomonas chlororaphis]WDG59986.1 lysis protein [Pseudomonas chlororaphis]
MTITPFRFVLAVCLTALIPLFWFVQVVQERDDARRDRDSAQREAKGLREAARISGEMLAERSAYDLKRTKELNHALDQNDSLQRDVLAGSQRLLINATCPAAVRADSRSAGLADAGPAELAANTRPDYFTLRRELALTKQMVLGLQDQVRICQRANLLNNPPMEQYP